MPAARPSLLFVDDEPGICETLPVILEMHGFNVVTAGTVVEALAVLASRPFDILISDLNIGSPGDGFTVVSAMRRTHPTCINFILTGYPAFETALQAIRCQVDDYLIKPANPTSLIAVLQSRLESRTEHRHFPNKRVAAILRENLEEIARRTRERMEVESSAVEGSLASEERLDRVLPLLRDVCSVLEQVQAPLPDVASKAEPGEEQGWTDGYSSVMPVADMRLLERAAHDVLHENLLDLDLSELMPDLSNLNDLLLRKLEEKVRLLQDHGCDVA